jgi:hypothetical protein
MLFVAEPFQTCLVYNLTEYQDLFTNNSSNSNLEYDPDGTLFAQIPIYDSDETITGGAIGIPMHNLVHAIIDDPPVPGIEDTNDNSVYNDTRRITINMNKRSLESDITEETSQCMQGLKQPMQTTAPTKSTAPKQGKGQEPKIRKRAIDLDKEREAPKRARPGEEIDAGAAKFLDGWMKKADGEFEKAMGFAAAAREQLSRRPWPSLEEGSAFIENMKKGTLDPQEVQRRMQEEEEEEEERRQRRRSRRTIRIRCLKGSKRSTATSTAASTVRSKPQKLAFKQEAAAEQMVYKPGLRHLERLPTLQEEEEQLTTRINISETSKSRSAARGNPLTSSNTLQNAKVLIAPANTASATSSQSRTLDPPSATSGRRTRTMAADDLESNLGEKWKIHVTSNGRRPCVKSQHESKSRHDGQPPNQDSSYIL